MAADEIVFWVFAPISIGSAIAMLLQRNAVHAALFLVVNFFTIAVFYLVLGASFLFAVQIIVYAGAIMVLFLFVIMLLGEQERRSQDQVEHGDREEVHDEEEGRVDGVPLQEHRDRAADRDGREHPEDDLVGRHLALLRPRGGAERRRGLEELFLGEDRLLA